MSLFDDLPEPTASEAGSAERTPDKVQHSVDANVLPKDRNETRFCPPSFELYIYIAATVARKGERPEMQDAHLCIDDMSPYLRQPVAEDIRRLSYFGVFDGHGGDRASTFVSKRLHLHVSSLFPKGGIRQIEKDIRRVLYDAYKRTDEEFLREAAKQRPHWRDGSTAATVLLVNNTLYIANLGDSKVVLARASVEPAANSGDISDTSLSALCLTRDHNPVDYEERQRIQATGASVQNGRVNSVLEVSRSFGDYQFKKQGVICIPDVRKCQLTPNDRFILIACDGLWKSFPPNEAVALTNRLLLQELNSEQTVDPSFQIPKCNIDTHPCELSYRSVEHVCAHLVNEAVLRMSGDNVTCTLIVFPSSYKLDAQRTKGSNGKSIEPERAGDRAQNEKCGDEPPCKISRSG
ncbi:unnamed protein product [Calicophoron daubneyi]|uniref:PPM-type phosphatase domain-containing protein n=1 Tax=Calicophoron daubneyi TaxID=300641 RepID=A0AAV2T8M8_CALDB